jgi:hypothetical protein
MNMSGDCLRSSILFDSVNIYSVPGPEHKDKQDRLPGMGEWLHTRPEAWLSRQAGFDLWLHYEASC